MMNARTEIGGVFFGEFTSIFMDGIILSPLHPTPGLCQSSNIVINRKPSRGKYAQHHAALVKEKKTSLTRREGKG
jgi:hypothetical protein